MCVSSWVCMYVTHIYMLICTYAIAHVLRSKDSKGCLVGLLLLIRGV